MQGLHPGPLYDGAVTQAVPTRAPRTPAPGAMRSGVVIATSLAAWSIGAYVFYLLAGRLLGPAEYGLAAALQAVIVVVALPMTALQWSSARVVAASRSDSDAAAVYRRTLVTSTLYACALAAAATVVTIFVAARSNGIPIGPLVAMYWSLVPVVPLFVAIGVLQGQHRYAAFGWSYGLTGVLRPILLLPLIAAPVLTHVESTVVATGIPCAIGAGLAVWLTRSMLRSRGRPSTEAWRSFRLGLGAATIGLAGIAILTNVDVVAAKLALGGDEAGYFGAAAIIAKALMLVPQALTVVLLPRVAERQQRGQATGSLLAVGVLAIAAAGLLAMALAVPLEGPIVTITFGTAFEPAAALVVPFFGATTLLGALLILVNHHVARNDHRFAWAVGALAIVQVILLVLFGTSAGAIIAIDAIVAGAGLVIHEVMYLQTDESMLMGAGRQARSVLRRIRARPEDAA